VKEAVMRGRQTFAGRKWTRVLVVAAGLSAVALGLGGLARWRQARSEAADGLVVRPLFPAGTEQSYRIAYQTKVGTTSGQALTGFSVAGSLSLVGLMDSPARLVRGAFTGTISTVGQAGAPAPEPDALAAAARRPFALEFGRDGRFLGARVEPGVPSFVARLWTALGEYLQVLRAGDGQQWQTEESDAAGRYVADYERHGAESLGKRKLRYSATAQATSYEVQASSAEIGLDDEGRLAAYVLAETLRARAGRGARNPLPDFESESTLDLTRTAVGAPADRLSELLADNARAVPVSQIQRGESQQARDRSLIGGFDLAEALSEIAPFAKAGGSREDRTRAGRAFVALVALVREDAQALAAVRANLQQAGPLTTTLLAALRDAGSPEAQRMLVEMASAGSPLAAAQRLEASRALSLVAAPDADTVQALRALRADSNLAAQASYGLGSALHRLEGQDPALAAEVRTDLVNQLAMAQSPADKALALGALGNAGDPATLDAIGANEDSADPSVRAAVAQAVRRIPGSGADQTLATLCQDGTPAVRFSAVQAIGERASSPALITAVSALAVDESDLRVRAGAVNDLARWAPGAPAADEALTTVASRDPNADLRTVAANALAKR
jgi:hypothetical protein